MGVGSITEAREVTRGTVSDGGSSVRVGGGAVPKLAVGVEDALGERLKKVESLGIVGNAWMARRERAVDEAERLIRDHELESRTVGYTDEHGVRRPGIETLSGEQSAGAADAWQRHNLQFAEKVRRQQGIELDQQQWDELRRRLHKDMTRTYASLSKWSALQVAGAEMVKVGADYAESLKRRNGELASVGFNDAVVGAEKTLGADDEAVAKLREDLEADDIEHYVSSVLRDRDDFVVRSVGRGYGLKSAASAKAEADKAMRESAEAAVLSLAQAGHYDRARKLVEQGRRLGYDDAAIAKGRELVDGYEMNAATANGIKAYNTVWDDEGKRIGGRDKILDAQIATLKRVAENAPKGSRTAIAALQQAGRFEEAADSIAYGDLIDGIAGGNPALFDVKNGKATLKEKPFDKKLQSRAARLWPKAVEAYNAQVSAAKNKAMKAANEDEGAEIAKAIANRDPQSYYRWLTERCKDGAYSTDEYKVHEAKFKNTWMSSIQPELISEMAAIVDSTFGVEFSKWLAVDKNGNKAVNPLTGQSVPAKNAVLPDIPYMVVPDAEVAQLPWWSKFGMDSATAAKSPYRTTLSGADMKEIMDSFLHTWMHNGKDVSEEQLKKEKYIVGGVEFDLSFLYDDEADGKDDKASGRKAGYHRIDAVRDFKRICDRINLGKRSLEMWKKRSDPSLLKEAEKSAMRPAEIKAMGTLKAPYAGW